MAELTINASQKTQLSIINYQLFFRWIVDGVVQTDRLVALACLLDRKVCNGNHIAQLAELAARLGAVVEPLGLLPDDRESLHGTLQAQVRADDTHIVRHDILQLLAVLQHKYHLLCLGSTLEVPIGNTLLPLHLMERFESVTHGAVGLDHCLGERVRCHAFGSVESRA